MLFGPETEALMETAVCSGAEGAELRANLEPGCQLRRGRSWLTLGTFLKSCLKKEQNGLSWNVMSSRTLEVCKQRDTADDSVGKVEGWGDRGKWVYCVHNVNWH